MSATGRFIEDHPDATSFEDVVHTADCRCSEELKHAARVRAQQPEPASIVWDGEDDDATGSKEAA